MKRNLQGGLSGGFGTLSWFPFVRLLRNSAAWQISEQRYRKRARPGVHLFPHKYCTVQLVRTFLLRCSLSAVSLTLGRTSYSANDSPFPRRAREFSATLELSPLHAIAFSNFHRALGTTCVHTRGVCSVLCFQNSCPIELMSEITILQTSSWKPPCWASSRRIHVSRGSQLFAHKSSWKKFRYRARSVWIFIITHKLREQVQSNNKFFRERYQACDHLFFPGSSVDGYICLTSNTIHRASIRIEISATFLVPWNPCN